MPQYHGVYRSNKTTVDNPAEVESLLDKYHIDGQYELDGHLLSFSSTATTFAVWGTQASENKTREFLEKLAEHIEEKLHI
jgi:hypothetical protein